MTAFARERRRIVTTDWILAETGNGLARTNARAKFVEAVGRLRKSSSITIVNISDDLFGQALEMFSRASDKGWGLVDCASFVVMSGRGVTEAFTNDHHFAQAGSRCLL